MVDIGLLMELFLLHYSATLVGLPVARPYWNLVKKQSHTRKEGILSWQNLAEAPKK